MMDAAPTGQLTSSLNSSCNFNSLFPGDPRVLRLQSQDASILGAVTLPTTVPALDTHPVLGGVMGAIDQSTAPPSGVQGPANTWCRAAKAQGGGRCLAAPGTMGGVVSVTEVTLSQFLGWASAVGRHPWPREETPAAGRERPRGGAGLRPQPCHLPGPSQPCVFPPIWVNSSGRGHFSRRLRSLGHRPLAARVLASFRGRNVS